MSVIAKFQACNAPRSYGPEQQFDLQAVCDQRLYAGQATGKENENRSFSQATPSGDARLNFPSNLVVRRFQEYYIVFMQPQDEAPKFHGASAVVVCRCGSIAEFGGTSRQVEVYSEYGYGAKEKKHPKQITTFNMRMMIDNPKAADWFEAGKGGYWVAIYNADDFDISEALADAHA